MPRADPEAQPVAAAQGLRNRRVPFLNKLPFNRHRSEVKTTQTHYLARSDQTENPRPPAATMLGRLQLPCQLM